MSDTESVTTTKFPKDQILVSCQYKEWYGDEGRIGEEGHGRHKNKGGEDFVIDMSIDGIYYSKEGVDGFIARWNKANDRPEQFFRYEAKSVEHYCPPRKVYLDDDLEVL